MFYSEIKAILHRPLIDLRESPDAEFFANAAAKSATAFLDSNAPLFPVWIQRRGVPGLRDRILLEAKRVAGGALAQEHTCQWAAVQRALSDWTNLSVDDRIKLARVLMQVGCYESVARALEHDVDVCGEPRLALLHGSVLIGLHRAGILETLPTAELLDVCEAVARRPGAPLQLAVVSTLRAFLVNLQYGGDAIRTRAWYERALGLAVDLAREASAFLPTLLASSLYRATAMWPHSQGDLGMMAKQMERCEELALTAQPTNATENFLCTENLFSVYESRTKERLALNDLAGAEKFSARLVELFPYCSTARIELGEVLLRIGRPAAAAVQYEIAAEISPPGSALAWFMAGEAHVGTGQREASLTAYIMSQRMDPMAISAVFGVQQQVNHASRPDDKVIAGWCAEWLSKHQSTESSSYSE